MALEGSDPFSIEQPFTVEFRGRGFLSWPIISHVAVLTGGTIQGHEGLKQQWLTHCFHRGRSKAL